MPNESRTWCLGIVLILVMPLLLGAWRNKWVHIAEHDLVFVKALANDGVRFGPRFLDDLTRGRVAGCNARPSKLAGLDSAQVRQIKLYSDHHCNPWYDVWGSELSACDGVSVPKWCESGNEELAAAHLKVDPYFGRLTTALSNTADPLERYNIMAVVADRLNETVLRDYPESIIGAHVFEATSEYLEKAPADEALDIGWQLYMARHLDHPALGRLLRDYRDRVPDVTEEQSRLLEGLATALEDKDRYSDVLSVLDERYGHRPPPPPPPPPPDRTDPVDIALLVKRVDTWYGLVREKRFSETWQLVALDYREGGYTQEGFVRTEKHIWRGSKLVAWRVQNIVIQGNVAMVVTGQRGDKPRGLFDPISSSVDSTGVLTDKDFWIFESGTWFNTVRWPRDWKENQGVEVAVPHQQLDVPAPTSD